MTVNATPPISGAQKIEVSARAQKSPRQQIGGVLTDQLDLVVALLLLIFTGFYYWGGPLPALVANVNYHDSSWSLDIVQKARHGIWFGREHFFTYGPLLQWLLNLFCSVKGPSFGSFTLGLWVFQWWTIIVALYFTGKSLLSQQAGWKRAFCLLLLVVFWVPIYPDPFDIKLLLPLCTFAAELWVFAPLHSRRSVWWRAVLVAALTLANLLLSADAGAYALIALALVAGASLVRERAQPERLAIIARVVGVGLLLVAFGVLAANVFFGSLFNFHFWRVSFAIIQSYRWSEAWSLLPGETHRLAVALIAFGAILMWRWFLAENALERYSLVLIAIFGVGMTQSLLVLSEPRHVSLSAFPLIAFSCYLLFGGAARNEKAPSIAAVFIALGVTATFTGPNAIFEPANARAIFISQKSNVCPRGLALVDEACVTWPDYYRLSAISDYVDQNTPANSRMGVFPHQNIYGFFAHRLVAGAYSGSYIGVGDYLNSLDLIAWRREPPPTVVYSADWEGSARVAGIPNFIRNPRLWIYLQQWYEKDQILQPRILGLRRSPERGDKWQMQEMPLSVPPATYKVGNEVNINLGPLDIASKDEADFIKFRVNVRYPIWWKVLKPSYVLVDVHYADGSIKEQLALAEPNHNYEIWIFPWRDFEQPNYFEKDPALWREDDGPPQHITGISLRFKRMDWASVLPESVTVSAIDGVRVSLK